MFLVGFEIIVWEGNYVIRGKDVRIRRIGNTVKILRVIRDRGTLVDG